MSENLFDSYGSPAGIPLSQFTAYVTRAVNSSPELFGAWVISELSDVRVSGGHCYMELIEKNESGQTVARMRATIWQSTFNQLRRKFFQVAGRDITTGLKVLVKGNATHHSLYGLSFNVTDIDPSYTLGDLERLRKEILMKLQKEGIIDLNKQRKMPVAPQRIAVISAEGAAGYGDFLNHLLNNRDGFVFYPCLFQCTMQGDRVADSIINALEYIESTADLWDCVAIVRGGGSTSDLNGFDNYELARAVALCGLPVVVGIGHERDRNVLDEIAHTRLKTPTAVAGFFIDQLRSAFERAIDAIERIKDYATAHIYGEERRLTSLQSVLPQLAARRFLENQTHISQLAGKIPLLIQSRVVRESSRLDSFTALLSALSSSLISNSSRQIEDLKIKLGKEAQSALELAEKKIENIHSLVKVLDPVNTLKRGYSITRSEGKAITNGEGLKKGSRIETIFFKGSVESIVD